MNDLFTALEVELKKRYYGWEGARHFDGTSKRLLEMVGEFCWTGERIRAELDKCFQASYIDSYEETLVSGPTQVWTLCPHHLLPCEFAVYIGYVPDKTILGLSKFSRIAVILGRRPTIQEMYSREVADEVEKGLAPKGVGVFVIGKHGCMRCRGVRQEACVTTSMLRGVLRDKPEARAEFLSIVRGGNGK